MPKPNTGAKLSSPQSAKKTKGRAPEPKRKNKKNSPARTKSATLGESSPIFSKLKLSFDAPTGPRIPIGEALRQCGLDEYAIAKTYVHVMAQLTTKNPDGGVVAKLLVDVLKECSRQIEASQPPARANADAPVIVQLVHAVSRPARALPPAPTEVSS